MEYKEITTHTGMLFKKKYKQVLEYITDIKKAKVRQKISQQVFDSEDSISDNAKLISLLLTIFSKLYAADFDKSKLDKVDKIIIDSLIDIVQTTKTRFSTQFEKEGYSLLSKLLQRQQQIDNIISSVYSTKIINEGIKNEYI